MSNDLIVAQRTSVAVSTPKWDSIAKTALALPDIATSELGLDVGMVDVTTSETCLDKLVKAWSDLITQALPVGAVSSEQIGQYKKDWLPLRYHDFLHAYSKLRVEDIIWTYPSYSRFGQLYHHNHYNKDRTGYSQYLKDCVPEFVERLSRGIPAIIPESERKKHTYIVAGTGSGKSELIKLLIAGYAKRQGSAAVILLDPHGELVEQLANIPEFSRNDRLVLLSPDMHDDYTFCINPLQTKATSVVEKDRIAQSFITMFEQILKGDGSELSVNMQALIGPCVMALLDRPNSTFKDLQRFMDDERNHDLVAQGQAHEHPAIADFFKHGFKDKTLSPTKASISKKIQSLLSSPYFYRLTSGPSSVDLYELIEQRKIILINLGRGVIGETASEAFGRLLVGKVLEIALGRQSQDKYQRTPTHLIIDECQNYISLSIIKIMEEARKFGLHLTLCQQSIGRNMGPEMREAVLQNSAVKIMGTQNSYAQFKQVANIMNVDVELVQDLGVGEFVLRSGAGKPAYKFRTHKHLLESVATKLAPPQREALKQSQLETYYRKLDATEEAQLLLGHDTSVIGLAQSFNNKASTPNHLKLV